MKFEYRSASERANYTLDYYQLWAEVPNALGQTQADDEVDLWFSWVLTERIFLHGVTGMAWPGEVLKTRPQGAASPRERCRFRYTGASER